MHDAGMANHMNEFVVDDGDDTPSTDVEQAWHDWFAPRADHVIDPGDSSGPSRSVTRSAPGDLTADDAPAAGDSVVRPAGLRDAERLLDGCPMVGSRHIDESIAV